MLAVKWLKNLYKDDIRMTLPGIEEKSMYTKIYEHKIGKIYEHK